MAEVERLPAFPYHPDPVATGSVVISAAECVCCGRGRGFVYVGPTYCEADLPSGSLCPWCIADGRAAERFDAMFTDPEYLDMVDDEVRFEVVQRTPGFIAWQDGRWLTHCGDAAAFVGPVGARELAGDQDALESLRSDLAESRWSEAEVEQLIAALDKDGQPTAYLFACRGCGRHLAYWDST